MVLTGDSLLVGDVGGPDFGGGDPAAQFRSVRRLLGRPDWVAVFPGHFEGPCGKGMCGRPSTTIGGERRFSPMLVLAEDAFVSALATGVPPRPLNMTAIEATNRGTADMPWAMLTSAPPVRLDQGVATVTGGTEPLEPRGRGFALRETLRGAARGGRSLAPPPWVTACCRCGRASGGRARATPRARAGRGPPGCGG